MLAMSKIHRIRDNYFLQHMSISAIAKAEDVDWKTVKKYIVMENFNEPSPASKKPRASRLELHYIPKHGSWHNIAEIELNVMTRQCLARRIESIERLRRELSVWESKRNNNYAKVHWHFRTEDAREKLARLYPKLQLATLLL